MAVLQGATVDMHPSRNEDRVTPFCDVHILDVAAIQAYSCRGSNVIALSPRP